MRKGQVGQKPYWDRPYAMTSRVFEFRREFLSCFIDDIDYESLYRVIIDVFSCPKQLSVGLTDLSTKINRPLDSCRTLVTALVRGSLLEEVFEPPDFDRPIFIIAAPRSGSTLLFDHMRKISGIWSIGGESHKIFDGVLQHQCSNPQFESVRATQADATPERTSALIDLFSRRLIEGATGLRYLDCSPRQRPRSVRLLDKLPKNSFRVAFLKASFPNAQFIFLSREPRGNISSLIDAWREGRVTGRFVTYKRLPGTDFKNWCFVLPPGWRQVVNQDVEEIAAFQWMKSNEMALDDLLGLSRDSWCSVSYSALTSQPLVELRRLCEFVGQEFDSKALGLESGALAVSRAALLPPGPDKWKSNAAQIERVLPKVQATAERLEKVMAASSM